MTDQSYADIPEEATDTDPAPDSRPQSPPTRKNPARKVALLIILMLGLITAWYATTDRLAPYTPRGAVAAYIAEIAPRVSGRVTKVFVRDNALVEAGEPLFEIDKRPFEIAVRQAEAKLARVMQQVDASSAALISAEAQVAQARANLDHMRIVAGRTLPLAERGVASAAQRDTASANLRTAEAQLAAAEANLRSAEAELGQTGQNNPQIQAARSDLEQAQFDLFSTMVAAPGRGIVTNLQLTVGQYLAAGSSALTFLDAQGAWIVADFRENQLANIKVGDRAGILFDAMPGTIFPGRVHSVAWGIDPGRTTARGLPQNEPETRWFEPARRLPVRIELEGGMDAWPRAARPGGKVSTVIYTSGENGPIAWIANTLHHLQSVFSYLY